MEIFLFLLELIGTVAFAVSGAMTGLRKQMDIFGVAILGLLAATGGGVIRDILLGKLPPAIFQSPVYAAVAVCVSIVLFFPAVRHALNRNQRAFDRLLFLADALGLGIFTVVGVQAAFLLGQENVFLAVFVGTVTGVGGGVLRDMLAGNTPYIFVKHVYACAAIAGGLVCAVLYPALGDTWSMLTGLLVVVVIRCLAAHYRWSLPKAHE